MDRRKERRVEGHNLQRSWLRLLEPWAVLQSSSPVNVRGAGGDEGGAGGGKWCKLSMSGAGAWVSGAGG